MNQPAVFLDRDGVINHNRPDHVKTWEEFAFLPQALGALRRLAALDWPVVVVSNQAAVGRGLVDWGTVEEINTRMAAVVRDFGGRVDAVLCCPHRPDEGCACRKPQPGLLLQAAERLGLDLEASFLIGDAESDVLAARSAGCRPVLVETGRGAEQLALLRRHGVDGFHVAASLAEAVDWIFEQAPRTGVT
jgi:D-glycero-D-manno-heptose 1,7-bisphosphate phosphatase